MLVQRAITHPHPHPATLQQAAPVAAADAAAGVQRQRHPPSLTAASAAPAAPTPRAPLRSPGPSLAPPTPAAAAASVQLRGLETPVRGSARERYATSPSEGSPAAADIPAVVQTPPPMAAPQQPPPLPKGRPWEPTPTLKAVFDDEREAAREGARQDLPEIPRHQRAPPRPLPPTPVAARRLRRTAQAAAAAAAEANAAAFAAALQPPAAPPGSAADAPVPDGASSIPRVADTVQQQQDAAAAPQASQPAVASDAAAPAPDGCSMSAAASVKTPQVRERHIREARMSFRFTSAYCMFECSIVPKHRYQLRIHQWWLDTDVFVEFDAHWRNFCSRCPLQMVITAPSPVYSAVPLSGHRRISRLRSQWSLGASWQQAPRLTRRLHWQSRHYGRWGLPPRLVCTDMSEQQCPGLEGWSGSAKVVMDTEEILGRQNDCGLSLASLFGRPK